MTGPRGAAERPTLATTAALLESDGGPGDQDLRELVQLAYVEHEPAPDRPPVCPSCDVAMPCSIWSYAEHDTRQWIVRQVAIRTRALHARIDDLVARGIVREGPRP